MLYGSQKKETGAPLFSGEVDRCSTVFKRRDLVLYCSQGEGNGFSTLFGRREQVYYCYQEKATGALLFHEKGSDALLFSGERHWCTTVLRRREQVL